MDPGIEDAHGTSFVAIIPRAARAFALNPVRAGLCRQPAAWRWSSYPAAIGWAAPALSLAGV